VKASVLTKEEGAAHHWIAPATWDMALEAPITSWMQGDSHAAPADGHAPLANYPGRSHPLKTSRRNKKTCEYGTKAVLIALRLDTPKLKA
jgi:hypothetical protein